MDIKMSQNLFEIVTLPNGLKTIKETKTNYALPIMNMSAICILLNYVAQHGDVPDEVDTLNWEEKEKYQKYLQESNIGEKE